MLMRTLSSQQLQQLGMTICLPKPKYCVLIKYCTCSCGFNCCSSKQKHWILLKYWPASKGITLYVLMPVTGLSVGFLAV